MSLKDEFNIIFATDGAIYSPFTETFININLGWSSTETPDLQTANWVYNDIALKIQDLKSNSIPLWDSTLTYESGSIVRNGGTAFHIATGQNTDVNPESDGSTWPNSKALSGTIGELKHFNVGSISNKKFDKFLQAGWYVCDGSTPGVPDLMGFLFQGTNTRSEIGTIVNNGNVITPSVSVNQSTEISESGMHDHNFDCGDTALTVSQLPQHNHFMFYKSGRRKSANSLKDIGGPYNCSSFSIGCDFRQSTGTFGVDAGTNPVTSDNAKGQPHTHTASLGAGGAHTHTLPNADTDYALSDVELTTDVFRVITLMYRPDL